MGNLLAKLNSDEKLTIYDNDNNEVGKMFYAANCYCIDIRNSE